MARFANAAPPLGEELGWPAFVWLAGLLEGEGTFLTAPPSEPRSPVISCRMTDHDVVERVATAFGTSVQANDKGPYKTEFAATIRGSRAVALMMDLRSMMGARRQAAIDRALESYTPPKYKLDYAAAEEIRWRWQEGETVSSLARRFGVARQTIHQVLDRRIYAAPAACPWRGPAARIKGAVAAGTGLSWAELYWLAGWLEGEGSFVKPPPSSPRRPRILGSSCDEDVIQEVAHLLRVEPQISRDRRGHWSPLWRVMLAGGRAITLMQAIAPIMGSRRTEQIVNAINAAAAAGAVLGWHENPSHRCSSDAVTLRSA